MKYDVIVVGGGKKSAGQTGAVHLSDAALAG